MRKSAEKKSSARKWVARGVLFVMLLACWFLLNKCGHKPEPVLSGVDGTALSQENDLAERPEPQGVEQGHLEEVMDKKVKEKQAEFAGSVQQAERDNDKALSPPDPSVDYEVEQALVQAQQLNPGDRDPGLLASKPVGQLVETSPLRQHEGGYVPGESQVALEAGEQEASISDEERAPLCPRTPNTKESVAEAGMPPGKNFTDPVTGMSFVLVKGGCFQMGSNSGASDEMPVHEVCVDDFYMGEYEVTQAQYEWITGHNPSAFKGCGLPVESVSWEDAQTYIRKLNKASGQNYRLPSEAEWEYAARSSWKEEAASRVDPREQEYAWYIQKVGNLTSSVKRRPNGLGLYDMNCNVWEWVSDWYGADYYARSPRINPQGPPSGSHRVIRAGNGSHYEPRFAKRYGAVPSESYDYFGFRVAFQAKFLVKSLPEPQNPEISNSADPSLQKDVSVSKVESVSGPAPTQPFL